MTHSGYTAPVMLDTFQPAGRFPGTTLVHGEAARLLLPVDQRHLPELNPLDERIFERLARHQVRTRAISVLSTQYDCLVMFTEVNSSSPQQDGVQTEDNRGSTTTRRAARDDMF